MEESSNLKERNTIHTAWPNGMSHITGRGEKLSINQAEPGQAITSAAVV